VAERTRFKIIQLNVCLDLNMQVLLTRRSGGAEFIFEDVIKNNTKYNALIDFKDSEFTVSYTDNNA